MGEVLRMDANWHEDSDAKDLARFREQDVELLLDQAADLLDRILRDKATFDDLGVKLFEMQSLQDEVDFSDAPLGVQLPVGIDPAQGHREESIPFKDAQAKISYHEYEAFNSQIGLLNAQLLAVRSLATTNLPAERLNRVTSAAIALVGPNPGDTRYQNALLSRNYELATVELEQQAQDSEVTAVSTANLNRACAAAIRNKVDIVSARFEDTQKRKRLGAAKENGHALNYIERRASLKARIDEDFDEAKARISKAAQGLKSIYGYFEPLPLTHDSLGIYDRYLISVRKAISHLVAITRRDQEFSLTMSLKQILKEKFLPGLKVGRWEFNLSADDARFPSYYRLVRLRGAGLSVFTDQADVSSADLWVGSLRVTTSALTAECHVGRVCLRNILRDPDIAGQVFLHNLSPFSTEKSSSSWIVSVDEKSIMGKSLASVVSDVLLDLRIVAQLKEEA